MSNIIIKAATPDVAASILELNHKLDSETIYRAFAPGERETTVEQYSDHIGRLEASINSTILIAWDSDMAVGILEAIGGCFKRTEHIVHVNIGILKSHWRMGIGIKLFDALENWARQNNIKRIELSVFTDNKRALALYNKLGFREEGLKKDSFLVNGNYYDEFLLSKII